MESSDNKPRLIAFEVTRRCRFHCRHCRAEADGARGQCELSTDQCKRILGAVADFHRCVLILTGGEPLERDDAFELIEYGRAIGLRMVSATCGYPVDDETAVRLKEAGILALSISLDGASAKTHDAFRQTPGAFEAAVRATKSAARAGIRFQINTTITKSNIEEVPAIARLARELGAYCFNPFILVPTGRARDIADQIITPVAYESLLHDLLRLKLESPIEVRVTCGPQFSRVARQASAAGPAVKVSGCMGGRGFGFISYRGDVQTCGFLDISAGNVVENGYDFGKIWTDSRLLNDIRDYSRYKGKCGACPYGIVCRGCRARAYAVRGDYLETDPVCAYRPGVDP